MAVNRCTFVKLEEKNISNPLKYFLRQIFYSVVCFQGKDSLKQIIILLNGKIMHVIEWVTKTVNRDGKNLRHLKSQKNKLVSIFFVSLGIYSGLYMSNTLPIENYVPLTYETKIIRPGRFFHWKVKVVREWPWYRKVVPPLGRKRRAIVGLDISRFVEGSFPWGCLVGGRRGPFSVFIFF